ncbi:MAG: ribonuclease III [Nitrospirota bacterium]|nr:ribonuclease III [Nitrospirota bacterium]MDH5767979.1 ribonuclease III [Nitrospirota bacterium]
MTLLKSENTLELENRLGYFFKNKEFLIEALTHRSFSHETPENSDTHNERLEFLGDSVLGFVIVEYLFLSDNRFAESSMAKIKSYLVKESILSEIANVLSLGEYLRLGKGEEATGGRIKKSLLADALEAVLGAVYVDGGYGTAKELILRLFNEKINAIIMSGEFHDFKTELQERTQLLFNVLPEYRVVKQEGAEHKKIFTVEVFISGEKFGRGSGKSKKEAQTIAAKEALSRFHMPTG